MSLRIRRGTDAQRAGTVFDLGEPVWTTNIEQLWIGDGITAGGKSIAHGIAGPGLTYNPATGKLETSNATLTTDAVAEGLTNKYFTNVRASNAVALAFANGSQSNISITYNNGNFNVSVPSHQLVNELTPKLGADLDLNAYTISGVGDIRLPFFQTNYFQGIVTIGTQASYCDLVVYNDSSLSGNVATFYTTTQTGSTPSIAIRSYRSSFAHPISFSANDFNGALTFEAWDPVQNDFRITGAISSQIAPGADFTHRHPATILYLFAGNNSDNITNLATFDYTGTFTSPKLSTNRGFFGDGAASSPSIVFTTDASQDTGFFHPGDGIIGVSINGSEKARIDSGGIRTNGFFKVGSFNGSGNHPNPPETGMIIFDSSDYHFYGYNGTAWKQLDN